MLSHGFWGKLVDLETLSKVKKKCFTFAEKDLEKSNYYKITENKYIEARSLLNEEIYKNISTLLKDKNPILCAIELHIQKSSCRPIPPHQDNFYHCIKSHESLKVLIPLQELNEKNGGLIFYNSDINFPVLKHSPSKLPNFSAYIEKDILNKQKFSTSNYQYKKGDASFHFINSIHFSNGNITNEDSFFLVFRFQTKKAEVINKEKKKYEKCYAAHLSLLND